MFQTATPVAITPAAITHDRVGNMTKAAPDKDGDWTKGYSLKWDAWNRLVEVRTQHDDPPVASYQYDGLFRRTLSTAGGNIRQFLYDRAWRILEERPGGETATPDRLCTWGLRHRTDMICRDAGRTDSEYAWNFAFHGQFEDNETGCMNYGYRYCSARTGRWFSRDPYTESGGLNLYSACLNATPNWYDHLGSAPRVMNMLQLLEEKLPKRDKTRDSEKIQRMTEKGCIGVVCSLIGRDADSLTSSSICFDKYEKALKLSKSKLMVTACCQLKNPNGDKGKPVVFAIAYNPKDGKNPHAPATTEADYKKAVEQAEKSSSEAPEDSVIGSYTNPLMPHQQGNPANYSDGGVFDFGYIEPTTSKVIGANPKQLPDKNLQPQETPLDEWRKNSANSYKNIVYCVACTADENLTVEKPAGK